MEHFRGIRKLCDTSRANLGNIKTMTRLRLNRIIRHFIGGVPGGIRTPNLLIRSQKLYPVELQAQRCKIPSSKTQNPKVVAIVWCLGLGFGILRSRVADGTRTRNNQNHNLGLYH